MASVTYKGYCSVYIYGYHSMKGNLSDPWNHTQFLSSSLEHHMINLVNSLIATVHDWANSKNAVVVIGGLLTFA